MAVFSFFNEKGGSGKSLHSVLFGSYLAYARGARVCLLDFEFTPRLEKTRKNEDNFLSDEKSVLSRYLASHPQEDGVLDIVNVPKEILTERVNQREKISDYVSDMSTKYDYVIMDLPAEFSTAQSLSFIALQCIVDMVAVPFDYTPTVFTCAANTAEVLRNISVPTVMFWNKVSARALKRDDFLDRLEVRLIDMGFDVLPHRIKYFQKAMRESKEQFFVVSTYCWPRRYVEMSCPALELLYSCLKERLDAIVAE